MSLPQISELAGAWAQLVAFSPVLNMFDQGDVEILNDDIPEYQGPAGIIGTVLALLMVAIGAVKKIYAVNEYARSSRDITGSSDMYFRLANLLDKQKCASLFLCSVAFQSQNQTTNSEKQWLLQPFISNAVKHSADKLNKAIQFGLQAESQQDCFHTNSECPFPIDSLEGSFLRARRMSYKIFTWLKQVATKISKNRHK